MDLNELMEKLKTAQGYQLGISILNKKGNLEHNLVTKEFPKVDMLSSLAEIRKLVLKDLERASLEDM